MEEGKEDWGNRRRDLKERGTTCRCDLVGENEGKTKKKEKEKKKRKKERRRRKKAHTGIVIKYNRNVRCSGKWREKKNERFTRAT